MCLGLQRSGGYAVSPREATSFDPVQWKNPNDFDLVRYNGAPTSHQIDEAKCEQVGFAKCFRPARDTTTNRPEGHRSPIGRR